MAGLHDIDKKAWERLLKANGFRLDRTGKHAVWKHEDGRTIPVANGPTVNPCVARRMVKENRLEGAPYGWSELAKKSDAKAEAIEQQRQAAIEADIKAKKEREAHQPKPSQIAADDNNRKALERAKAAIAEIKNEQTDGIEQTTEQQETGSRLTKAQPAAPVQQTKVAQQPKPAAAVQYTAVSPQSTAKQSSTPKTSIYMNEKRLENFHRYLIAVVEYYYKNGKTLKNFSSLAPRFSTTAISIEQFAYYKLGDMKPEQITRELSDRIRLEIAEADRKRREEKLKLYMEERERMEQDGGKADAALPHVPTLAERIDTFEARFDLLGPVFGDITSQVYEYYKKEFGPQADELLGADSWRVRMSPAEHLSQWAEDVEFDLTRIVFDDADPDEVKRLLPTWSEKILHAYLTWLYGGKDGQQLKLNFDERGSENSQNEELVELLQGQGLLDQMLFVKLESWKGCAHCVAVYSDAPDVLMVIGESEGAAGVDFYTVSDDIWYTDGGDTVINPERCCEFGGWGTRSIVARCLRQMLSDDNHKTALQEQQKVTKPMRGKLMDDIHHYRDIWQRYHDEYEQQQRKGMIDFGN